ncbi:TonB-dependent receptor [Niabella pedocola]|uniref:TonB-dependent receptor n=1 Tax=Niabella pedocola TaxID=1752077 RepID=A0ABS8PTJ2_9BACT|nr:TonB-dependent receptor [Niabella pedocola]MCD2424129.1 TonB-dependent receptor [Niabella pedocola]
MKLTMLFLLFFTFHIHASGFGQQRIHLKVKKTELAEVLRSIEAKTSYRFLYNNDLPAMRSKVTLNARDATIEEVLPQLLFYTDMTFQLMANDLIVLRENPLEKKAITVTGKVTDSSGAPLSGVSVQVKGTTIGTVTNVEGAFTLSVPDANSTLVFSMVGYDAQEYPLNGNTQVNITLIASQQVMDQVVVIGYGTARKRELTGSVASVKGEELAKQPVQTPTQALQGKVSGVQVISSGQPNAAPKLRIRGTGSTLSGAEPLYVVDGVITDDIRNINNNDIVTMEILKDASSTAIYGMRAANGVVLITTKKGRKGKMKLSYDMNIGLREASKLVDMAGANQYAGYLNEANISFGTGDSVIRRSALTGANTDWYDAILQKGFQQNHNLSISGGGDNVTYFLSAGYLTDQGIQKGNDFKRFTLRSNNEYIISKKLKFSTLLSFTNSKDDGPNAGAFQSAYRAAPIVPAKVGSRYGNTSLANNVSNPLVSIDKTSSLFQTNRIQGAGTLEYKPVEWLTLKSSMGIDANFIKNRTYDYAFLSDTVTFLTGGGNQQRANSQLALEKNDNFRYVWDNTVTFAKRFDRHNITFLVGMTAEEFRSNSERGTAINVPVNKDQWYLNAGTPGSQTVNNEGDKWARNSYLSRLMYSFDERYSLTASIRADGTSRFGSGQRWGYFPSVGAAWNVAREVFMQNQDVLNDFKIRASWGHVGNDGIPSSLYQIIANTSKPYYFDGTRYVTVTFDDIADPNLHWEVTDETDIGIDFATLNSRLSGTIDYYNKKAKEALTVVNIPKIFGDDQLHTNAASFQNTGMEFSLNWADKFGTDWRYSIGGNLAFNNNKVLDFGGGQPLFNGNLNGGFTTLSDNGHAIGSFYLLQMDGIFQSLDEITNSAQPGASVGDIRYKDLSGPQGAPDGVINDFDRAFSGAYQPRMTYGANGSISNKNWDFSIGTYGTSGSKIYNGKKALRGTDTKDNIEAAVVNDRWTLNNPSNKVPRATLGPLPNSTYFLENGNFFRINNVTLGYTFSGNWIERAGISRLRLYVTSQNLFTFTHYSGFTPEILSGGILDAGIERETYPATRTFAFGINASF